METIPDSEVRRFVLLAVSFQEPYKNLTACQALGNMCVAIMYTRESGAEVKDACAAYLNIAGGGGATIPEWFVLNLRMYKILSLLHQHDILY